jgi:hypothetical protein
MAKIINLNFRRNVNVFINGNPSSVWPHVLQTVGLRKNLPAALPLDEQYATTPQLDSRMTWARNHASTVLAYAPTAVAGNSPILITCAANEARFQNARRISEGVWSSVLNDGSAITLPITLLAEESRTNLLLQSNSLTTAPWGSAGGPAITQNVIGLDGATSAWTVTDASNSAVDIFQTGPSLTSATTYVATLRVKKTVGAQSSYPVFYVYLGTNYALVTIDTTNGIATAWTAITGASILASSATCVPATNTFWRVVLTFTTAATGAHIVRFMPAGTTNPTQSTGSVSTTAQGSAVVTNFQLGLGSKESSYIPTTTVAVTRPADVASFTGAGLNWYNSEQGTFVVRASGTAFRTPSAFGTFNITFPTSGTYVVVYNNLVKDGSTYLYTWAGGSTPTEYTGISVPTMINLLQSGLVNISRLTYYPIELSSTDIVNLLVASVSHLVLENSNSLITENNLNISY